VSHVQTRTIPRGPQRPGARTVRARRLSLLCLSALALAVPGATACGAEERAPSTTPDAGARDHGGATAVETIDTFIAEQKIDTSKSGWKTNLSKPPQASFDDGKTYYWNLDTNKGPIRVRLLGEQAPMHVSSTIYLTRLGFYDDVVFHRVITDFMAQGGDPLGQGTGSPGYQYSGEFPRDASGDLKVKHDRPGMLSMANAGPGTDGSQFFLTFVPTPWLDGKHTIFGEVVDGMDTLKALEAAGSSSGRTTEKLVIQTATISSD